ncbi:MAG: cobyric acid synthase [Eubacteriales bacterium]|nr:cobyric acid synthase [Eubacteriales bacterium]
MRGKSLMFQGTGSSVGKSMLCAAVLRILKQDGLRVAPFKAQNMALNSFATSEGLEMGRAQVTQAEAAGVEPSVRMNPVLLKPTSDRRSQVIVNGKPIGTMSAMEYDGFKPRLREMVKETYDALEDSVDVVVIEGAGSPAEINLKEGDIVNMSMAKSADAPVILIGDINPGGVFASLYGTVKLLDADEQARIKGIVINKFRGDVKILEPGLRMLEELLHIPVIGVIPWMDVDIEDEDSVTERFNRSAGQGQIRAAIVQLPHISNFTDFSLLAGEPDVSVVYASRPSELKDADIILLPGTKNTIEDLNWLKQRGLADEIVRHARSVGMVIGICGGYQMLGETLRDPLHTESRIPEMAGLGLLNFDVTFNAEKRTVQAHGAISCPSGWLREHNGLMLDGYEIHSGENTFGPGCVPFLYLNGRAEPDGVTNPQGNVLGSYLHGIFDTGAFWRAVVNHVRKEKGLDANTGDVLTITQFRDREFDRMATIVRQNLDMDAVYKIIRGEDVPCGRWEDA